MLSEQQISRLIELAHRNGLHVSHEPKKKRVSKYERAEYRPILWRIAEMVENGQRIGDAITKCLRLLPKNHQSKQAARQGLRRQFRRSREILIHELKHPLPVSGKMVAVISLSASIRLSVE
jgi:hypothetical protein